jgi:hypothetical protein
MSIKTLEGLITTSAQCEGGGRSVSSRGRAGPHDGFFGRSAFGCVRPPFSLLWTDRSDESEGTFWTLVGHSSGSLAWCDPRVGMPLWSNILSGYCGPRWWPSVRRLGQASLQPFYPAPSDGACWNCTWVAERCETLAHPGVGFVMAVAPGDRIEKGDLLGEFHAAREKDAVRRSTGARPTSCSSQPEPVPVASSGPCREETKQALPERSGRWQRLHMPP